MTQPINPYVAGNPLRGEKGFFGRQDTLQWVERELRNPATNALVLAGQRRIGKTSLMLQLERTLPDDGFLPIYFDLQDKAARPLGRVLAELAGKIARRIKWQLPEPDSFDDRGLFFQNSFLPNLYQELNTNCRPVLLLDEFDVMDQAAREDMPENAAAKILFSFLHSVMTEDPRPAFVFAVGRQAEDLSLDSAVIFKASLRRDIWVLDEASAKLLVRNAEENGTLRFTDRAVAGILKLTSGHPYLTQLLCQRIWERAYTDDPANPPKIDLAEVRAAIPDALEAGHQVFIWLWNGLNPAEKIYVAALAEAAAKEDETISEDRVIQVLMTHAPRLRTREVELAPRDLVKHWVLEMSGKQEYRFAVELLRLWVRRHKPLQDVKNELDRIEPLADKFYAIGQEVLRRGKIEDAISNFQRALEAYPKHLHAMLDLGEIFLRLGRIDDAVAILENAYKLDEVDAHLPLARALVAQAKVKEKSGDSEGALSACVRALGLSPGEHTAHEIIHMIWNKRGNAAMEQGDVEKALAAYQQAGTKDWNDAVDIVRRALDEDPTLFRTRFYLGEVLLDRGRTDEALAESNAALIAYQQASSERQHEIIVFFRSILEQKPTRTLARLLLGQLLLINSQPSEALSEMKRAYEGDKSNNKDLITYILLVRAEAAHVSGEWLMSLEDCATILQIDPGQKHALEIMNETIFQIKDAGVADLPDNQFIRERLAYMHLGAKPTFGIDRNRLCELTYTAKSRIRLLGVIVFNTDWQALAHKWAASLRDEPTFEITILCESDNTLFSKSLTYDMDATENQRSFQELQFIRDRALIDFPDMLSDEGIPFLGNKRVTIEITHLPVPVSIVQIDERIFANLWLHDIEAHFEEIVPTHPWHSHIEKYIATYFDPMRGRKYASKPGAEVLEVFDHKRMPRGIYPRNSFYDTDYSQQVIWAFIFDRRGRLLIHRRADNAKDNQGMWDKSVGGHMEFGDFNNTSHAAYREVIEELFVAEPERAMTSFKNWAISDEEVIYLGEWRPEQRKSYPFKEISSFKREWAFFRYRESERLYSPRTLPDGTERRLRVIPDIFFFVAGPQLTDKLLDELKNSTFKLLDLSELKNTVDRALSGKAIPGFDGIRSGEGNPRPKFSPDLVNIMTGKLYDVLMEFSQYIKTYIPHQ
jgi:tetratricopeptide (TPR) repeat protein